MFEESLLIVAHPDDDILWLGSVVDKVDDIIFCFIDDSVNPDMGEARRKTIKEYPLANVSSLDLSEPQAWDKANWNQPVASAWGIKIEKPLEFETLYKDAYEKLLGKLRTRVADANNIFTHNPWGEYGHEEHVLVYRALKSLQQEFHFDLWYSNYCSNRSVTFMNHYISGFDTSYECLPVNLRLVNAIAEIYKKNQCWTWYEEYQWFKTECLVRERPGAETDKTLPYGHSFPLNYLKIHISDKKPKPHRFPPTLLRLKKKLRSELSFPKTK